MPLDRSRDLELAGRRGHGRYRAVAVAVLTGIVIAALLNGFGQVSKETSASGTAATLEIDSPPRLRGGLLFQARFRIHALETLEKPRLVLGEGWMESMTMNTLEPAPAEENSDADGLSLTFEPLSAGETRTVWTEWQVNPTRAGRSTQPVSLYDADRLLLKTTRQLTVFP